MSLLVVRAFGGGGGGSGGGSEAGGPAACLAAGRRLLVGDGAGGGGGERAVEDAPVLVEAALAKAVGEHEADEAGVQTVAAASHLDVPVHLDGHLDEVRLDVHRAVDRRHADRLRARRDDHVALRRLLDLHAVDEDDEAAVVLREARPSR